MRGSNSTWLQLPKFSMQVCTSIEIFFTLGTIQSTSSDKITRLSDESTTSIAKNTNLPTTTSMGMWRVRKNKTTTNA
jgi:hypothetical protein